MASPLPFMTWQRTWSGGFAGQLVRDLWLQLHNGESVEQVLGILDSVDTSRRNGELDADNVDMLRAVGIRALMALTLDEIETAATIIHERIIDYCLAKEGDGAVSS